MSELVRKLPAGFDTRVQKEVKWLIYTELLEIPFERKKRKSSHDALLVQIINQRQISDLFTPELAKIHAKLGLHRKRLLKLIDCLEKELKGQGDSRYKIREHYISRVFDLLDMLRTAARTVAM
jgi:hypothetical protein